MSELKDESIEQGTRKRTDYDNARRAQLTINLTRTDGGKLRIPIAYNMRSHEEERDIQQNTLLAIVPLARLPGHDQYDKAPKGGLPRPGRIYVFQGGKLWRELLCDGKGNLSDVDVGYWRKQADQGRSADDRPAACTPLSLILVPMLLQGHFVGNDYTMAYSELPWTWEYITWLEGNSSRVQKRLQSFGPAWSAAVAGGEQWRTTQAMPIVVIDKHAEGLRPRDFNVESALADPATFTPSLAAIPPTEWVAKLQSTLTELAGHDKSAPPAPLPAITAAVDVFAEKAMRGYPKLVGLILHDPLFSLRHATAQARQAESYLLALNALVPHRPNGRYAQLVYSTVMQKAENPLSKFQEYLDINELNKAVFVRERHEAREHLELMLKRLVGIFNNDLAVVLQDWFFSHDERLLEPYALLAEALDALGKSPVQSDALCVDAMGRELQQSIGRLSQSLLQGKHAVTRSILVTDENSVPEPVKRLQALAATGRQPKPERMGLSSLLRVVDIEPEDTDRGLVFKNVHALISDLMDTFSVSVLTHLQRLNSSGAVMQVTFNRLFAPSLGALDKLSSKWKGLQLMTAAEAEAKHFKILGSNSGGLQSGLTPAERTTLSRQNYLYGNILDHEERVIGSSSPRQLDKVLQNQGKVTLIVAPDDHPEVRKYRAWKEYVARKVDTLARTPSMPVVAVACALYNLQAQRDGMRGLINEGLEGKGRYQAGIVSAVTDLTVALGNLTKPMLGVENSLVQVLEKQLFDTSKISKRWAAKLIEQTDNAKLPALRTLSGVAMLFTTALSVWDAKRAWQQGDMDAALAYGVAASGGAAWTAYAWGMAINPFVLGIGAVLFIGGSIVAGWLVDSDAEALLKNGPFGREHGQVGLLDGLLGDDKRFAHLADSQVAYTQLLGILGKPRIQVSRFAEWLRQAPAPQRARLLRLNAERETRFPSSSAQCVRASAQPLEGEDWVVTVHSPLLAMFQREQDFQLHAVEQLAVLPLTGVFNVERVEPRPIGEAKVSAMPLDDASVLYVLPKQYPVLQLTPLQRRGSQVTQRLKVFAQFHLGTPTNLKQYVVLPQPSPKRWLPYNASYRQLPQQQVQPGEVPYWQIEVAEFKA